MTQTFRQSNRRAGIISLVLIFGFCLQENAFASAFDSPLDLTAYPGQPQLPQKPEKASEETTTTSYRNSTESLLAMPPMAAADLLRRLMKDGVGEGEQPPLPEVRDEPNQPKADDLLAVLQPASNRVPERVVTTANLTQIFAIHVTTGGLQFEPGNLEFAALGEAIETHVEYEEGFAGDRNLSFFVRDNTILKWDEKELTLTASGKGKTELFVVHDNRMYIVPANVGDHGLQIPDTLVSLNNLVEKSLENPPQAIVHATTRKSGLSIRDGAEQAKKTQALAQAERKRFFRDNHQPEFKSISLQVVDERSIPEANLVYAAADVDVRIVGTDFVARTDISGIVTINDLPRNGRFLVSISDSTGRFMPVVTEVQLNDEPEGLQRIRIRSMGAHEIASRINGVTPDSAYGSLCARAIDSQNKKGIAGLNVSLNVEGTGPFYFNQYGPDPYGTATDDTGWFCFFNVKPGLIELAFFQGEDYVSATALPVFAGTHTEEDISLSSAANGSTYLAAAAPALEQLYEDPARSTPFRLVDSIDLIVVGENEPMNYLDFARLGPGEGVLPFKGRLYGLAQAAEFEPTLYAYDDSGKNQVTVLFQRGFVEDLFGELYLQDGNPSIAFDQSLGSVIVHAAFPAASSGDLNVRLVNALGEEVSGGWFFGSETDGVTKVVFFNLEPGLYSIIAETGNGYWLDVDTVAVDYWTNSFVSLGNELRYRPN